MKIRIVNIKTGGSIDYESVDEALTFWSLVVRTPDCRNYRWVWLE